MWLNISLLEYIFSSLHSKVVSSKSSFINLKTVSSHFDSRQLLEKCVLKGDESSKRHFEQTRNKVRETMNDSEDSPCGLGT